MISLFSRINAEATLSSLHSGWRYIAARHSACCNIQREHSACASYIARSRHRADARSAARRTIEILRSNLENSSNTHSNIAGSEKSHERGFRSPNGEIAVRKGMGKRRREQWGGWERGGREINSSPKHPVHRMSRNHRHYRKSRSSNKTTWWKLR